MVLLKPCIDSTGIIPYINSNNIPLKPHKDSNGALIPNIDFKGTLNTLHRFHYLI